MMDSENVGTKPRKRAETPSASGDPQEEIQEKYHIYSEYEKNDDIYQLYNARKYKIPSTYQIYPFENDERDKDVPSGLQGALNELCTNERKYQER